MTAARIELATTLLEQQGIPAIVTQCRAVLGCGCAAYVGRREDNGEPAVGMVACGHDHDRLGTHFQLLMKESLIETTPRMAIEVVADLLAQADRYWEGSSGGG